MRRKRKRRREREKRERERKKRTEKKGRAKMGGGENSLRGSKEEGEEYLLEVVCTRRLLFPRGRVR